MKEKTLLKISIICALAGVFILYIISEGVKIDETTIDKIEQKEIGDDVKIEGVVKDVFNGQKVTIIIITQPGDIQVMLYGKNISVQKGDYVEVIGELDRYNNKLEVIGNRIRVVS